MSYSPSAHRLPLSPASPPESGLKPQPRHKVQLVTPQTPQSPSPDSMSVATKRYVSAYEDGRHTNEMANRSPQSYNSQSQSQRASISSATSQSQNPLKRQAPQDEEDRPTSKRQKKEDAPETENMEVDSSFTPTNHDRQKEQTLNREGQGAATIEGKGKDVTQIEPGKAEADLDPIFKHVGKSFRIGRTTHKRAAVDINQNLLGKYGLHDLLAKCARQDPDTGEKINKLRSSYAGQIKDAQLPGRNDHPRVVREEEQPSKLRTMATIPDDEFRPRQVERKVGDLSGLQSLLKSAMHLEPGNMNKQTMQEWDLVLGHEPQRPVKPQQQQPAYAQLQQSRIPNGVRPAQPLAAPQPDKMRTRGKKRSYGDTAYVGYGDGLSEVEDEQDRSDDYVDHRSKKRK